jgi:LacI family transcriptional regulator
VKVSAAAEKLAYGKGHAASSATAAHTFTVGVVVSDIQNPFYPELLDVLQTELGFLGIQALLFNQRTPSIMTPALMRLVSQHSLDGLILTSVSASWSLPSKLSSGELPTILLNRLIDGAQIDCVSADNVDGGKQAAEYLAGLGHQIVGIVGGPVEISTHRDRRQGFMEASCALGHVQVHEAPLPMKDYSYDTGFHSTQRILRTHPDISAVFCTNDLMAYGALSAARREGRAVPEDLSVLGFDDIAMSSWGVLDLSTIHHPFKEMAKAASQRLADIIAGDGTGESMQVQLPVHVVPRATTRSLHR